VFTMNGGTLDVTSAGGDGIDSNGWIVVNGGTLTASVNNANSGGGLAGLDADDFDQSVTRYGIFITGGNVTTDGTIGGVSQTGGTLTDTTQSNSR
ncbi:MAG: hypothetical protein IJR68_05970, partial [Fretibacterium sp.]|nr:hypothetical protein [Fretibacterium sp.]